MYWIIPNPALAVLTLLEKTKQKQKTILLIDLHVLSYCCCCIHHHITTMSIRKEKKLNNSAMFLKTLITFNVW
jgi:hypothetical protein